jgi:hypothetical protein
MEVDFEAVDDLLAERRRETRVGGDRTEEDLKIGVGEHEGMAVEEGAEGANPRLACAVVERRAQRLGVDEAALVRLVDGPLQAARCEFDGDVDQGADGGGDRDAVAGRDVFGRQGWTSANPDPLTAQGALTPDADIDPAPPLLPDIPQRRGTSMAQHSVIAAGEHRRASSQACGLRGSRIFPAMTGKTQVARGFSPLGDAVG